MRVYFTNEVTWQVLDKFLSLFPEMDEAILPLAEKSYGGDLRDLYVGLFCMDDKMAAFFTHRKPQYRREAKKYIHKGVLANTEPRTFMYELRLDYNKYREADNIRALIVHDTLASFDIIKVQKQIKDFRLEEFRRDFRQIFVDLSWI